MEIAKNQIDTTAKRRLSAQLPGTRNGIDYFGTEHEQSRNGLESAHQNRFLRNFGDRDWSFDLILDYRLFIG